MQWNLYTSATLALVCLAMPVAAQPVAPPPNDSSATPQAPAPQPDAPVHVAPAPTPAPAPPVAPSEPATEAPGTAVPAVEAPAEAPPAVQPEPPAVVVPQPVAPTQAAPAPAPTTPPTPPAPQPVKVASATSAAESDAFEERGKSLYIRLAVGFAIPAGPDIADDYALRGSSALHFTGASFATDWMAGSMLLPWLAVGVGAVSDNIVGGSVRYSDNAKRSLESSLYYFVIGPFADLYFSPPAGWHVQALLGVAHLARAEDLGEGATGFGAALGVGYEVAVARRWNIGALARMAISPLSMAATGGEKPSPTVFEPSLLFTATFRPAR